MRKNLARAVLAVLSLCLVTPAYADGGGDAGPDRAAAPVRAAPNAPESAANAAPQGRNGIIALDDGLSLNVPSDYRFYSSDEAQAFMQRMGAAPPPGSVLGLVAGASDDIRQAGTWATVISFDPIGYVPSETAAGLSDASFEADVQAARRRQNRPFEGFIAQPAFETALPSLIWAERAAAPGAGGNDLRFEQRVLGRRGVASLISLGSADQFDAIGAAATRLRDMLAFREGARYADFQAASDQVSLYSVPGLVTGVPNAAAAASDGGAQPSGQTAFGGLAGWFPWVALGVIVLAIGGYVAMGRKRRAEA